MSAGREAKASAATEVEDSLIIVERIFLEPREVKTNAFSRHSGC